MYTSSLAWPNMFNVVQNRVAVIEDNVSVVNRCKLLFLTQPTEVFNEPDQGVGLKEYLWHYNNDNTKALIQDKIKDQLRLHEPQVEADHTEFADGLLFTGKSQDEVFQDYNELKMTVKVETVFSGEVDVDIEL